MRCAERARRSRDRVLAARHLHSRQGDHALGRHDRGVESQACCARRPNAISDDHDGILEMPADAPVGPASHNVPGLDEAVIEITSRRTVPTAPRSTASPAISARPSLAITKRTRCKSRSRGRFPCPVKVTLDFGATHLAVPGLAVCLVRGVMNGPSPKWLQDKLAAIGLRPINALVDITNFITFDRVPPAGRVRRRQGKG